MAVTGPRKGASGKQAGGKAAYAHPTFGFGVPATSDPHHFRVLIPRGNPAPVLITEYVGIGSETVRGQVIDRVRLERGKACIRGMRVTLGMIVGKISSRRTIEEILADYPYLEREDILTYLEVPPASIPLLILSGLNVS